jgi:hypothetical protein
MLQKPLNLSEPLSALLGEVTVSHIPIFGMRAFFANGRIAFATANRQEGMAVYS